MLTIKNLQAGIEGKEILKGILKRISKGILEGILKETLKRTSESIILIPISPLTK